MWNPKRSWFPPDLRCGVRLAIRLGAVPGSPYPATPWTPRPPVIRVTSPGDTRVRAWPLMPGACDDPASEARP